MPLPFQKATLKAVIFIPFFSLAFHDSLHKLAEVALLLSDHGSQSMRVIIFEESVIVEIIRVEFSISLTEGIDYLSTIEAFVRHWGEFILCEVLTILAP